MLVCRSCIEPFEPAIEESQEVMVINGMITDQPGIHYVEISRATPYNEPFYHPVRGCLVIVIDETGDMIRYYEAESGKYYAYIPGYFLATGKSYSLQVYTSDQKEYRSDFDTLLPCPPIDSIYYEIEFRETSNPELPLAGIQFYMDMSGSSSDSRNFMWQLEETWEYWAAYFAHEIWWGGAFEKFDTYDIFKCWEIHPIRKIYTATTRPLSVNAFKKYAFNFVSNRTDRLSVMYSLLVKQQSLTRSAYEYWEKMRVQSVETGGLYETQPSSTIGNIYNTNDPAEIVLGMFYATQQRTKRIMVKNEFDFQIPHITCELEPFQGGFDFPYYLISISPMGKGPPYLTADRICFDCRIKGGTNVKPDYW
ncbi:MAG: hypothetical protein AMS27_01350 [Bacteroides sp. SM23_62_1]|nr:MAG: hypothetical protein AMS27_01350 [Bacteroides sp. SM23_62_1]